MHLFLTGTPAQEIANQFGVSRMRVLAWLALAALEIAKGLHQREAHALSLPQTLAAADNEDAALHPRRRSGR